MDLPFLPKRKILEISEELVSNLHDKNEFKNENRWNWNEININENKFKASIKSWINFEKKFIE